jgi:hypothetical protein
MDDEEDDMGYTSHSNKPQIDAQINALEGTRQTQPMSTQAQANTAEIAFYRGVKAVQLANGLSTTNSTMALQQLGTGGS